MDLVILYPLYADGLESTQADVQSDFRGLDAAPANAVEGFWCEMEASSGGCY